MKYIYFLDLNSPSIGSMSFFLCELSKQLQSDLVIAFFSEPPELLKKFYIDNGCNFIVINKSTWKIIKLALKYDKVLTGLFRFNLLITTVLALFRIPYVHIQHSSIDDKDLFENQKAPLKYFKKIKLKLSYSLLTKIITVSNFSLNQLNHLGISRNKLLCIPNGVSVDLQKNLIVQEDKQKVLEGTQQGKNKPKCIFIGSLEIFKGVDLVLDTALIVPDIDFYFAGDGALKEQILELQKKQNNIFYLGVVQNYVAITQFFDFAIIPSRWNEAFCYVAIESLYSGLPVIASNKGALPEVLNTGLVVFMKTYDTQGLAEAINEMMSQINSNNNIKINQTYTIERQVNSYVQLLRS